LNGPNHTLIVVSTQQSAIQPDRWSQKCTERALKCLDLAANARRYRENSQLLRNKTRMLQVARMRCRLRVRAARAQRD
jgi:hypothetical protein